jgi:hypothetical protein
MSPPYFKVPHKPPIAAFGRITVALLVLYTPAPNALAQANQVGRWDEITTYGMDKINPIHVQLLHNGKVLIVAGSEHRCGSSSWNGKAEGMMVLMPRAQGVTRKRQGDLACSENSDQHIFWFR